jgi:hypothetical protein
MGLVADSDEATHEIVGLHSSAETGNSHSTAARATAVDSAATATRMCRACGKQTPETAGSRKQIVIPPSLTVTGAHDVLAWRGPLRQCRCSG